MGSISFNRSVDRGEGDRWWSNDRRWIRVIDDAQKTFPIESFSKRVSDK